MQNFHLVPFLFFLLFFSNSYNFLKLFYINRVKIHSENSLSNRFILMYITKYSIISIYEIISYKSQIKIVYKDSSPCPN